VTKQAGNEKETCEGDVVTERAPPLVRKWFQCLLPHRSSAASHTLTWARAPSPQWAVM